MIYTKVFKFFKQNRTHNIQKYTADREFQHRLYHFKKRGLWNLDRPRKRLNLYVKLEHDLFSIPQYD